MQDFDDVEMLRVENFWNRLFLKTRNCQYKDNTVYVKTTDNSNFFLSNNYLFKSFIFNNKCTNLHMIEFFFFKYNNSNTD